ncbi:MULTISPECIES: histidinol phosphate phosphatase [Clostridium]|uniref:histidinol phosphate phosphatase n=1 Tax=Clostridium TaxID=1485 RepID=UPI0009BF74B8|nr:MULTISPECIES: histidinol phosphate phosphatase [Clostridium]PJI09355.1 histidinol-phosphatase [Clostridium sp. CT7]
MIYDTHIHTLFSTDSKLNIEDAVNRAANDNIGMIVTEHIDFNYPVKGEFVFNVDEYFKKYEKYRNDKVMLGVEIGMTEEFKSHNKDLNDNYEFDYVLGSIHFVNNIDLYDKIMYKDTSKRDVFEDYFKAMINCLECHDYIDSLAHIDYISRYATYDDPEIHYSEYSDYIDEVFKSIIDKGIVLEINTRRLNKKDICDNMLAIYKRYNELGGKFVTIGSDSHDKDSIGMNFNNALEMAEACGLNPVYFNKRVMKYC